MPVVWLCSRFQNSRDLLRVARTTLKKKKLEVVWAHPQQITWPVLQVDFLSACHNHNRWTTTTSPTTSTANYRYYNGHDYRNRNLNSSSGGNINSNGSNGSNSSISRVPQHGLETQHVSSYRYVSFVVFYSTILMYILGHSTCRNGSGSNSGSTGSAIGSRRDTSRAAGVFLYKFLLN
jgi:hypothetical protein